MFFYIFIEMRDVFIEIHDTYIVDVLFESANSAKTFTIGTPIGRTYQ